MIIPKLHVGVHSTWVNIMCSLIIIYICYSPAGRSVSGETVPEVLSIPRIRIKEGDVGN